MLFTAHRGAVIDIRGRRPLEGLHAIHQRPVNGRVKPPSHGGMQGAVLSETEKGAHVLDEQRARVCDRQELQELPERIRHRIDGKHQILSLCLDLVDRWLCWRGQLRLGVGHRTNYRHFGKIYTIA